MSKNKKFLMGCSALILIGATIMFIGFLFGGRVYRMYLNNSGFHVATPEDPYGDGSDPTPKYEENDITLDAFQNIETQNSYSDFRIVLSDHYGLSYCLNSRSYNLKYSVENNTLEIMQEPSSYNMSTSFNWFNFNVGDFHSYSDTKDEFITVYLPKEALLKNVFLFSESGDIDVSGLNCDSLSVKNTYGDINLTDVYIENDMYMKLETCSVNMDNTNASLLDIQNEYGDIRADVLAADSLKLNLATVTSRFTNLTVDSIDAQTEYGDIDFTLLTPVEEYNYQLSAEYGEIYINGTNMGTKYNSITQNPTGKNINISSDTGDITISNKIN